MAGVEGYVPNSTGTNYRPHVTFGVADEDFVRRMKAEPFETFTFRAVGVATYQLGEFAVAAKLLWQALPVGP
jgi:hypothetical protein